MTAHTFASSFSGFGGADLGAHAAGLVSLWGVEYEGRIADTARANGLAVMTGDVREVDWSGLVAPFWKHGSPPCPNFSAAKTGGEETEEDVALAEAECAQIRLLRPHFYSLENVRAYEGSESLRRIRACLEAEGYAHTSAVLCAADYGVPQTRDRLILVASRVRRPRLPEPTHADTTPRGRKARRAGEELFGSLAPWNGWYGSVADLLDALPDSALAQWQMKRLPAELRTLLICPGNTSDAQAAPGVGIAYADQPARAVLATAQPPRAILVDGKLNNVRANGDSPRSLTQLDGERPAFTVTTSHNLRDVKAVLVSGTSTMEIRDQEEPACTVVATVGAKAALPRAVLVEGQNGSHPTVHRAGDRTAFTVTAHPRPGNAPRAVLINNGRQEDGHDFGRTPAERPAPTVTTQSGHRARAIVMGERTRTVQLSPRCLGRFQSFPDSYRLPGDGLPGTSGLACKGIGNAVPPDLMTAVILANL